MCDSSRNKDGVAYKFGYGRNEEMQHEVIFAQINDERDELKAINEALNEGHTIIKYLPIENGVFLHLTKSDEDDITTIQEEPLIESVIQINIDDDPETVKQWTDKGWIVKNFYSKQVQLVKYREENQEDKTNV